MNPNISLLLEKLIKILFENGYYKSMTIKRIKTSINNTLQRKKKRKKEKERNFVISDLHFNSDYCTKLMAPLNSFLNDDENNNYTFFFLC